MNGEALRARSLAACNAAAPAGWFDKLLTAYFEGREVAAARDLNQVVAELNAYAITPLDDPEQVAAQVRIVGLLTTEWAGLEDINPNERISLLLRAACYVPLAERLLDAVEQRARAEQDPLHHSGWFADGYAPGPLARAQVDRAALFVALAWHRAQRGEDRQRDELLAIAVGYASSEAKLFKQIDHLKRDPVFKRVKKQYRGLVPAK